MVLPPVVMDEVIESSVGGVSGGAGSDSGDGDDGVVRGRCRVGGVVQW